jgi:molybdopterin synthase catalytic subunit
MHHRQAPIESTDHARPEADWVQLLDAPLLVRDAVAFVTDARAGGIDLFLGTTRAERNATGQDLVALDYEAYAAMAQQQLHDLTRRARAKWPILRLALLHRTGRVPVGEPSVLIAVATPHRAASFEACRWLIDTLKAEVAVWKKEVWADGTGTWVHPA